MAFVYPNNFAIKEIEPQLMARGLVGRVGLEIMPEEPVNAGAVRWTQEDDYYGLQAMRGLDGAPTHVQRVGSKTYSYEPGVFGEFVDITETELTLRAGGAPLDNTPIDVADLVMKADMQLINREYDRKEATIWSILGGTVTIKLDGPNGTQRAYTDTYTTQTLVATIPWSTTATAVPIQNLQTAAQLSVGYSVSFGSDATLYINQVTCNNLLNNANASDLGGRRNPGGATLNNLTDVNQYLVAQGLPKIRVYDAGYRNTIGTTGSTSFTKFIPNGSGFLVGVRPGNAPIGRYQITRNLNNPGGAPASYRYMIDRANGTNGEKRTPPNIEVHRGHSGGACILYPAAVVTITGL